MVAAARVAQAGNLGYRGGWALPTFSFEREGGTARPRNCAGDEVGSVGVFNRLSASQGSRGRTGGEAELRRKTELIIFPWFPISCRGPD